jgi:hypothetical protein
MRAIGTPTIFLTRQEIVYSRRKTSYHNFTYQPVKSILLFLSFSGIFFTVDLSTKKRIALQKRNKTKAFLYIPSEYRLNRNELLLEPAKIESELKIKFISLCKKV